MISQIKWRNAALFAVSLGFCEVVGFALHAPALTLLAYACGMLPCWAIVRLGWLE